MSPPPLRFVVPGEPVAKGRPRSVRTATGVRTYTPARTVAFEDRVRVFAMEAGAEMLEGPVLLKVQAVFTRPQSEYRKRKPKGWEYRAKGVDLDNVIKAVADALNGIAYADDKQVAQIEAAKITGAQDKAPQTTIEVRALMPAEDEAVCICGHIMGSAECEEGGHD